MAVDVELTNPLDEVALFEVIIDGTGLYGENMLELGPKQSFTYHLMFSPLRPFTGQGSLTFMHDRLGEIWYALDLAATDVEMVRLPILKAELGKTARHELVLNNPSNQDTSITHRVQNPSNYDVLPEKLIIPAYEKRTV